MPAQRPDPTTLAGNFIRLEPLTGDHLPGLYEAIARPEVFEFGFGGGPAAFPESMADFRRWANGYFRPEGNTFAVILVGGPRDGTVVGTTTLGDFDENREATHIGWSAYDPRVWGTAVNPEVKLLLLQHAFDAGFGRVKIQTDALNERSRAAIAKLGAIFEGVTRREQQRGDGSWRDSAVYSVVIDDWSAVKLGLETRLLQFDGRPVLFRTPRV
ncbi:MAG: GNAT family N-acetyltransferase [Microbacteriaceae bacterium]|nr:GNAT family N-acetyltransferase [Microbacteriaceae bacterium]